MHGLIYWVIVMLKVKVLNLECECSTYSMLDVNEHCTGAYVTPIILLYRRLGNFYR